MLQKTDVLAMLHSKPRPQNWGSRRTLPSKYYSTTSRIVSDYVVLDFETTGLRPGADRIIQVGAIKYMNHEPVDEFMQLINPQRDIPPRISQLTGITNRMVENMPTMREVLPNLISFIGDLPVIAHNASFDMGFLYACQDLHNIEIPSYTVIDTLKLARKTIQHIDNHRLGTLANFLALEHDAHDAIGDCRVTAQIYQYCIEQM